jgi:hypothetical protein
MSTIGGDDDGDGELGLQAFFWFFGGIVDWISDTIQHNKNTNSKHEHKTRTQNTNSTRTQ